MLGMPHLEWLNQGAIINDAQAVDLSLSTLSTLNVRELCPQMPRALNREQLSVH